jgi:hypothetical protein
MEGEKKQTAPAEVTEANPLLAKIDRMDRYHEREKRRWQDQNNLLSTKLRKQRVHREVE